MRTLLFTLITLLTFSLPAETRKPPTNVVIIFIDDMGYADIGPFGAKASAFSMLAA